MDSQAKWLDMASRWQQTLTEQWTHLAQTGGIPGNASSPVGASASATQAASALNPFAALAHIGMAGGLPLSMPAGAQALGAQAPWADLTQAMYYLQNAVGKDASLGAMPAFDASALVVVQQTYQQDLDQGALNLLQ